MKVAAFLIFIFLVTVNTHFFHKYKCVFDSDNPDLRDEAANSKPAVGVDSSWPYDGRRLLSPLRIPMRIHLD